MSDPNSSLGPNPQNVTPLDGVAFLTELIVFTGAGFLGFQITPEPWSWLGAIGVVLVAILVWGTFRAPRRLVPGTPMWLRSLAELSVGAAGIAGYALAGWVPVAAIVALLVVLMAIRRAIADRRAR